MAQSNIEWTELTWNPTTGCNKISAGCKFCYAEVMSRRLKGMGQEKYKNGFKLAIHPETLNIPYTWNKPQHTYQILTKRGDVLLKHNKHLKWTKNIWMGVSVENEKFVDRIDYLRKTNAYVKFLSLEPLIAPLN